MNEITQQKINIYEFPNCADEEENKMMRKLKVCWSVVVNGTFDTASVSYSRLTSCAVPL